MSSDKRRQVSIRGATYDKVKVYCETRGLSVQEFVDKLCARWLGKGEMDDEQVEDARPVEGGNGNGKDLDWRHNRW